MKYISFEDRRECTVSAAYKKGSLKELLCYKRQFSGTDLNVYTDVNIWPDIRVPVYESILVIPMLLL